MNQAAANIRKEGGARIAKASAAPYGTKANGGGFLNQEGQRKGNGQSRSQRPTRAPYNGEGGRLNESGRRAKGEGNNAPPTAAKSQIKAIKK